jgi:hypothetical protein
MTDMRAKILIGVLINVATVSAGELIANEPFDNKSGLEDKPGIMRANPAPQSATRLELSARRDGIVPYLPHARHVITIRAPESALQQGWRCCWIEAYSLENAKILSGKFTKPVQGNPPDIVFDATRTEASIRQIAPDIFQADVAIGSTRSEGSHLARLYVHLYRIEETGINADYDVTHTRHRTSTSNRVALNFLEASSLPIRFTYAPPGHNWTPANTPRNAVPSQLPNRAAPQ